MVDAYLPALDTFALDADEAAVIAEAMNAPSPWDFVPPSNAEVSALKSAKEKILAYHLQRHGGTCCYCRVNLHGAGPFMTDREHILPKSKPIYKPYSFTMWNLAAACKRCNMQFKKADDSFVVDKTDPVKLQSSGNYLFVHPNFDQWEQHLTRLAVQANTKNMVIILRKPGCGKADFTHGFFNLSSLEIDSFDQAQGLTTQAEESKAAVEVRKLAVAYGQALV